MNAYEARGRGLVEVAAAVQVEGDEPVDVADRLDAWLEEQAELRKASEDRREAEGRLAQVLDGREIADLQEELDALLAHAGERPDAVPEDLDAEIERAERRRDALADRVADLGGNISAIQSNLPSVAEAIEREAAAERQLEAVESLARLMDLTESHLQAAKERANANIAPALTATLRPWLPRITGGRYTDVHVDPQTLTVEVREPEGSYRDAAVLSHGTAEQVYLLLRLALAEHLATTDETAPIVLDDVTVQSDPERTVALLDLLHELSHQHQVIMFTQEQEVVDWARVNLDNGRDRLIDLGTAE